MIYSGFGSGSSSEFSEFWIRIQAKVPDPCGSGSNPCYLSIFGNCKQKHLKFNNQSINYLPFYISYYSPTVPEPVLKVQNSQRNYILTYLLFHILLDPCGSGSKTLITADLWLAKKKNCC